MNSIDRAIDQGGHPQRATCRSRCYGQREWFFYARESLQLVWLYPVKQEAFLTARWNLGHQFALFDAHWFFFGAGIDVLWIGSAHRRPTPYFALLGSYRVFLDFGADAHVAS